MKPSTKSLSVNSMVLWSRALILACVWIGAHVGAAPSDPTAPGLTREQTLSQDLLGPRVDLTGIIVNRVMDGDYTCFVLDRSFDPGVYMVPREEPQTHFIACNPGHFDASSYGPGRELRVVGNLGAAIPRQIGGQIYRYPLVAQAFLYPLPDRPGYYAPPPYYDPFYHPYYDPFWRPWPHRQWPFY